MSLRISNLGFLNSLSQSLKYRAYQSVSTIARVADSISLDDIRDIGTDIYKRTRKSKMLAPYCRRWIGIVDAHEVTASYYCKGNHYKKRNISKIEGVVKYQYFHQFTAFILAGPDFSFTLDIELIVPGESEVSSSYRLLLLDFEAFLNKIKIILKNCIVTPHFSFSSYLFLEIDLATRNNFY